MPARWKMGLAVLGLSIAGQLRAEALAPQVVISRCAAEADARLQGIAALSRSCPEIQNALDQLRLTELLPAGWQKSLTADGLAGLSQLVQRYAGPATSGAQAAVALRSIAGRLVPQGPPATWWDRIKGRWLDPLLQPLKQWLRSLGHALRNSRHAPAIFYGLSILLLIAVVAVLTFELRGTGLLRRLHRAVPRPRPPRVAANAPDFIETHSGEPDWARLRGQPARLLRLLVDTLTRAHRLERDRHLTCRELETEARLDTELEREGFARVARLAERELYGPPGAMVLPDDILRDVQKLHERLCAAIGKGREIRQ